MTTTTNIKYHVIHHRTGVVKSICATRRMARRKLDKHDNAYGGYAHRIVEVLNNVVTTNPCI